MANLTKQDLSKIKDRFLQHTDAETFEKETSFAIQLIGNSSGLQKCSVESNLKAIYNISLTGLTLNPIARQAYLIPRYNSFTRQMETVLEPSYMGLIKLLTDSGSVKSMLANVVYEKDEFDLNLADNINPVIHKPYLKSDRGEIVGFYSLATLHDGTRQVEWMPVDDVNDIKERSESYKSYKAGKNKSCVWVSDYSEMGRKTVIKRQYKTLPRTDKMSKVDEAISIDNEDYKISDGYKDYISSLIATSCLTEEQKTDLEMELSIMNMDRANDVCIYLKENQLDPISSGSNYSQKDILNKLYTL